MWEVRVSERFRDWWRVLGEDEQESLLFSIELLKNLGPALGRPHVDSVAGSKHSNMKELRTQHAGRPYRTLFAFDPTRTAILLIGGDKTGDSRFYQRMIPIADQLFDEHLAKVRLEAGTGRTTKARRRSSRGQS